MTRVYKTSEKVRARVKAYSDANREAKRAYHKRWREANPEKFAAALMTRRARKKGAEGKFTDREWFALNDAFGWKCLRCDRPHTESALTKDHVVPLRDGGSNDISNIQPLCLPCNLWKNARTIDFRDLRPDEKLLAESLLAPLKFAAREPKSREWLAKISQSLRGYRHTKEACLNMSIGVKDSWTRRGAWASSKSGIRGVHWDSEQQRWRASLTVNGRRVKLGRFATIEEASSHLSEFKDLLSTIQGAAA